MMVMMLSPLAGSNRSHGKPRACDSAPPLVEARAA
jgi:hypothetical protein